MDQKFGITISIAGVADSFNRMADGVQQRLKQVEEFNKRIQNGTAAINTLMMQAAAVLGVSALGRYASEAMAAEKNQQLFAAALHQSGRYTAEYNRELLDLAKTLSRTSGRDDDDILGVIRRLVADVPPDLIRPMTQAILDLSAATGTDLNAAANAVQRGLMGEELAIGRLRLQIDKTLPRTEQIAQAIEQMNRAFGGQGSAAGKNAFVQFAVAANDAEKAIGELLNRIREPFMQTWTQWLRDAADALQNFDKDHPIILGFLRTLSELTGKVVFNSFTEKLIALVGGVLLFNGASKLAMMVINPLRSAFVALFGINFMAFIQHMMGARREVDALGVAFNASVPAARAAGAAWGAISKVGLVGVVIAALDTWREVLSVMREVHAMEAQYGVPDIAGSEAALRGTAGIAMKGSAWAQDIALPTSEQINGMSPEDAAKAIRDAKAHQLYWRAFTAGKTVSEMRMVSTPSGDFAQEVPGDISPKELAAAEERVKAAAAAIAALKSRIPKGPPERSFAWGMALDEESLKQLKSALEVSQQFTDDKHARGLISDAQWLAERKEQLDDAFRKEVAMAQVHVEQLRKSLDAARGAPNASPVAVEALEKDMAAANTKLATVRNAQFKAVEALDQEAWNRQQARDTQQANARIALAETSGQKLAAAKLKIEQEYQEKLRNAPVGDEAYKERLRTTRELKFLEAEQSDVLEQLARAEQTYNTELEKTANLQQTGSISGPQARSRNAQAARDYLPTLQQTIEELRGNRADRLAVNAAADVSDLDAQLKKLLGTLAKVKQEAGAGGMFKDFSDRIRTAKEDAVDFGNRLGDAAVNGLNSLSQGFTDAIMGAKSLDEAMADVARSVVNELLNMAIKAALFAAVFAMLGGGGGFAGGIGTFFGLKDGGIVRAAGGFVSGPGGPRGDAIPAMLSDGEAVLPAGVVAQNPDFIRSMISGAVNLRNIAAELPAAIAAPIGDPRALLGAGGGFNGTVNVSPAPVSVAVLNSTEQVRAFLESAEGRKVLYNIQRGHMLDLGLTS
ncbi:MAG: hypothetical protein WA117_20935 [Verrucomicrobiia bacterium]